MAAPLRLGAHPSNASLQGFADRPDLHPAGLDVFAYNSGNQTIPLVTAGALDVMGTGATPPVLALAQGLDVVMIAMTPPRTDPGGVLVRADSAITTPADLRGRSIAMMPTSWHPHYVAALLDRHGIAWSEAVVVELNTPTAREALLRGGLDAWIATGPDATDLGDRVRVVAEVPPYLSNRSVLWATRAAAETRGAEIADLLSALAEADAANPRAGGWLPVSAEFVAEQQAGADLLAAAGEIPAAPDVAAAVVDVFGKDL